MDIQISDGITLFAKATVPMSCKAWIVFPFLDQEDEMARSSLEEDLSLAGYGIFQIQLLTPDELKISENTMNLELLSARLSEGINALLDAEFYVPADVIVLGNAMSGTAALVTAFEKSSVWPLISVVVIDGRPDLVRTLYLENIQIPVLLLVGEENKQLLSLNQLAENYLNDVKLVILEKIFLVHHDQKALRDVLSEFFLWMSLLSVKHRQRSGPREHPGGTYA